ncbi:hypothetical protein OROGR_031949 [Orobanche gracilis]
MVEGGVANLPVDNSLSTEELLSCAQGLVPKALEKSKQVKGFPGRWKMIISKLQQMPSRMSDLSSHPCFSNNALCKEQLQTVSKTLNEAIELAEFCLEGKCQGKLRMQSDLDTLAGKLDLNLRDCGLLIKTGVLGEVFRSVSAVTSTSSELEPEPEPTTHVGVRELLARLQIGHLEAKHKALDTLVEIMKDYEKSVLAVIGRSNISALVSEGVLPPLIRLVEPGGSVGREKAAIALQRLSMSSDRARSVVGHGGTRPLIELCQCGDSVSQAAAACALKNISAVPEARQTLADERIVEVMINLLDCGMLLGSKEYAAECFLMTLSRNCREVKNYDKSVPNLVTLLDPSPHNMAKKYAVCCLGMLCTSKKCKKLMVSYGAIGYLKKLTEMDTPGAKKSLERLERGRLKSFFSRK